MSSSRGDSIGASAPKGMRTVSQLAKECKVSADTIRRWANEGWLTPIEQQRGELTIRLFDDEQAKKAKSLARQTGYMAGRKAS